MSAALAGVTRLQEFRFCAAATAATAAQNLAAQSHTLFHRGAPPARCSKFGKLSMAYILLFCLSLFSFVSRFFFSLFLSLTHAHGSFSPPLPLSLSFLVSLSLSLSLF